METAGGEHFLECSISLVMVGFSHRPAVVTQEQTESTSSCRQHLGDNVTMNTNWSIEKDVIGIQDNLRSRGKLDIGKGIHVDNKQ